MDDIVASDPQRMPAGRSQTLIGLGIVTLLLAIVLLLRQFAWIVTPLAGSSLLLVLLYPVYSALERSKVPKIPAAIIFVVTVFLVLLAILALITYALSQFTTMILGFTEEFQLMLVGLEEWLNTVGVIIPQAHELIDMVDIPAVTLWTLGHVPSILSIASTVIVVSTIILFQAIESTQASQRVRVLNEQYPQLYTALRICARRTRQFFGVTTIFAVIVGILNTILLYILGIPSAPLWGLLAVVANYVPFLGFWVALVPPALLALAIHGPLEFLIVVVGYLVLNFLITSLLPTKFVSDTVGLSMVLEVVSIIFWAWVLGPMGAILAIPLTIFVKAVLIDTNPNAAWLRDILSSRKSLAAQVPEMPSDLLIPTDSGVGDVRVIEVVPHNGNDLG